MHRQKIKEKIQSGKKKGHDHPTKHSTALFWWYFSIILKTASGTLFTIRRTKRDKLNSVVLIMVKFIPHASLSDRPLLFIFSYQTAKDKMLSQAHFSLMSVIIVRLPVSFIYIVHHVYVQAFLFVSVFNAYYIRILSKGHIAVWLKRSRRWRNGRQCLQPV